MARTQQMRLIELMILKQDITKVLEYLGKKGSFQFQDSLEENDVSSDDADLAANMQYYSSLQKCCNFFNISLSNLDLSESYSATDEQVEQAGSIINSYNQIYENIQKTKADLDKVTNTEKEALAFANLQVSFSQLEHLSFLSLKVGKIDSASFESLQGALANKAVVIALGEDKSHVLIASSKKSSGSINDELEHFGFVEMQVPQDFTGVPEDVLAGLAKKKKDYEALLQEYEIQKENFAETHKDRILELVKAFAIKVQIGKIQQKLESTEMVYRITGWVPLLESKAYSEDLEKITEGRIALREFEPGEVREVLEGREKVPVKLHHGKFIRSFERMVLSYGSPLYGTIDPTPFVAVFFTILFGMMFGDLGQGLVFLLLGLLMAKNIVKVGGWNKFAPIFMAIGVTSSIMGLLTGEFFSNETLLEPFSMWVTGLFGHAHAPIIHLMPSQDPKSIMAMFAVFGVAVGFGFVINTVGLLINIINNFSQKKYDKAIFGKEGLAGAVFFWYVIVLVIRIAAFGHSPAVYDWVVIGITLFFAAFAEPFENLIMKKGRLFENGFGTYLISSVVELIEVFSGYLSNTVSFVRVGAFALSHAVLDFTILTLSQLCGPVGGIFILIIGNAIIIVLEGMIVAIQVIRLQYYEFFSKFFHETGREFKPFAFTLETN
ncbi:MAG: ATPase [Treponema sp.]|nr:ATPase [Treponema sp.]